MKNIFSALNAPYYIYAPAYREDSGGIRAMHCLCHALNLAGEEAYIISDDISEKLRTPHLTESDRYRHQKANREPIVVYPEIVTANPLRAVNVVRYLLNIPGFLSNEPVEWQPTDLVYTHGPDIVPEGIHAQLLQIPLINTSIYNSEGVTPSRRKGKLLWISRFLSRGGQLLPITEGATEISYRVARRTAVELSELYRNAELLYTYEQSTACYEAMLCGCPVVYIPNDLMLLQPPVGYLGREGWAWGTYPEEIQKAKESVHGVQARYKATQELFWKQLDAFIEKTQNHAHQNNTPDSTVSSNKALSGLTTKTNRIDDGYRDWLFQRSGISNNHQLSEHVVQDAGASAPRLHLLIRLTEGFENLLADTLDSLGQQHWPHWHLDIISTLLAPEGLGDLPCVGWHTVNNNQSTKEIADFLVSSRKLDWVIEIPAGAQLDSLYLWRLTEQAKAHPHANAIFVDDDCTNNFGNRHSPRFKPGCNPLALQSADLAGPICVSWMAWQTVGGATQRNGSPWFSLLLRTADTFGWETIKHIPDILISYPDSFPSDTESCIFSLVQNMRDKKIESEIIPVSSKSWCVRYPLTEAPRVTIAILSIGQLDLLSRCITSVIEKTDYPNFEIIVALTNLHGAPDLDTWLANAEQITKPKTLIVRTEINGNYATRCNAAAQASFSDYLLFLKEEAVVIQEKWLDELIRSGIQSGIGGVSPRMIQPGSAMIENEGSVLGLNGIVGAPYQGKTKLGEELGYLDCIHVARDVSTLPAACMLIRKESYVSAGGMDESDLGNHLAEADLCLKIRRNGERLIYQPLSNIVSSDPKEAVFDIEPSHVATQMLSETHAKQVFFERWYPEAAVDRYWNPALSLATSIPAPELEFHARWQAIPSDLPRILAHALPNGQGDYRITSPLSALSKAGMASECMWRQRIKGEPRFHSIAEIVRLKPDSVIVQNYTITPALAALQEWDAAGCRPFTVYALDDLITDMDVTNPFRKDIPANARARLQYALKRCDRLVVSTDYLAEAYQGFISDIRVVPNRLEQASWLPLRSQRRTSNKPRIGWAGGTTHQGDLLLLKGIIEQTRDEADWIFFGMCPEEIRPLLAEYHPLVKFSEYPGYLASLNLDLAVAPLAETPFNRGKSNLRLLDYGVLGIPVVCTDIEPYRNSPACCVNNSVAEWTEAIRARIHDPEAREREGDTIRRWVLDGYLLEKHLEEWLEAHLPG